MFRIMNNHGVYIDAIQKCFDCRRTVLRNITQTRLKKKGSHLVRDILIAYHQRNIDP